MVLIKRRVEKKEKKKLNLKGKKMAAEGLICAAALASGCGAPVKVSDAGPDSEMDADAPRDVGPDSDQRSDSAIDSDIRPDVEFDVELDSCPDLELACPTWTEQNGDLTINMGASAVVGGVRITALRNERDVGIVELHCDSTDEPYGEMRLPLMSFERMFVDTATVELVCGGIIGGRRLSLVADVQTPCR